MGELPVKGLIVITGIKRDSVPWTYVDEILLFKIFLKRSF